MPNSEKINIGKLPLIFVDVEGGQAPGHGEMTEFGAVDFNSRLTFHGRDNTITTFMEFEIWLKLRCGDLRPVFVSDNPAYDWQWINYYFWKHLERNPFGHSARRISDFYAGLRGDFSKTQEWKKLRVTEHDHNPVHDALGNVEAFEALLEGRI